MKTFRFFSSLLLLTGSMVLTSCEKWDILYDCDTNEVLGALFPGSPEGNIAFGEAGVLSGQINPVGHLSGNVGPADNRIDNTIYGLSIVFRDTEYKLDNKRFNFNSKSIPVKINVATGGYGTCVVSETVFTGRMKPDGYLTLDDEQFTKSKGGTGDLDLYIKLDNGQRLRFRFKTIEKGFSNFAINY